MFPSINQTNPSFSLDDYNMLKNNSIYFLHNLIKLRDMIIFNKCSLNTASIITHFCNLFNDKNTEVKQQSTEDIIHKTLGSGSYGIVYLVQHNNEIVARKDIIIRKESQYEKESTEKEIILLKSFRDRNILIYKDSKFDESTSTYHIYTEYLSDGDLLNLITKRKNENREFTQENIISFLKDIVNGLKYIHSKKVIHRDLKPSNIFVASHGELVIGDFGLSLAGMNSDNILAGTKCYMAPELLTSHPPAYSTKSDIFALGCILYELYCLNLLYPYKPKELIFDQNYSPNFLIRKQRIKIIEELIMKMIEKDPFKRINIFEINNRINKTLTRSSSSPNISQNINIQSQNITNNPFIIAHQIHQLKQQNQILQHQLYQLQQLQIQQKENQIKQTQPVRGRRGRSVITDDSNYQQNNVNNNARVSKSIEVNKHRCIVM